jgi:hypothetical protein
MVGIYKYENGLVFTGVIATSKEKAETYLAEKYGSFEQVFNGKRDENGYPIYERKFVPKYNKSAFVIKELKQI